MYLTNVLERILLFMLFLAWISAIFHVYQSTSCVQTPAIVRSVYWNQ